MFVYLTLTRKTITNNTKLGNYVIQKLFIKENVQITVPVYFYRIVWSKNDNGVPVYIYTKRWKNFTNKSYCTSIQAVTCRRNESIIVLLPGHKEVSNAQLRHITREVRATSLSYNVFFLESAGSPCSPEVRTWIPNDVSNLCNSTPTCFLPP